MCTYAPAQPPTPTQRKLPEMDCNCNWSWTDLFLMFFFSFPHFFFFLAEEPFSFYSDQTSYLSICLEEHNRFQVEHFSQEELKKKVLTY